MEILKRIAVPTGDICIVQGDLGKLEMLSIGDYGKDVNLKADFMGLDRQPSPVKHTAMLPLEEKWVITISTQYSCRQNCSFCSVPKVKQECHNATFRDLVDQVFTGVSLHPEVKNTKRLNIHYARMGEPTWNNNVLKSAVFFKNYFEPDFKIHPVVSTMMPKNNPGLSDFIWDWMDIKNEVFNGEAGLQLSINSTDERERDRMFRGSQMSLSSISDIVDNLEPYGRKITLNFALGGWSIDPKILLQCFDPKDFLCKLTPLHMTNEVRSKNMMPEGDWTEYAPYRETEEALKEAGYDVITFIASKEEDESRITCGNAILADEFTNK